MEGQYSKWLGLGLGQDTYISDDIGSKDIKLVYWYNEGSRISEDPIAIQIDAEEGGREAPIQLEG